MTDSHRPGALALLLAALALLAAPALAQEADLDLKPADFSPDETVAIRVDDLRAGTSGTEVVVSLVNRGSQAVAATVECSLFDAEREDLGLAVGSTGRIAPGERSEVVVAGKADGAQRAYCRVKDVR